MSTDLNQEKSPSPIDDGPHVYLLPWQFDSIYGEPGKAKFLYIVGGRGAGKSKTDAPRVIHWSSTLSLDLAFGIFANTDTQLQTVLAPIEYALDEMGYRTCFEKQAPPEWQAWWRRLGTVVPPRRFREVKFWIWEDGTHIAVGSMVNHAYTRFKGIDMNAILLQEATEPGVTEDAWNTLAGNLRCGKARKVNGIYRCMEPGHIHQLVVAANVPLNDPSHFVYKKVQTLQRNEARRMKEGLPTFFVLMSPKTQDNPFTGEGYDEVLRAAFDPMTYVQQTSGSLERNMAALTYHQFREANILDSLRYDPRRPLHIWFDFNNTPAVAGWGHDLRHDEVPPLELKKGHEYFGVVGELFSDNDWMGTEQVARALLEDPTLDARCRDCGDMLGDHFTGLWVCRVCGKQCEGQPIAYTWDRKYLHLPPDEPGRIPWRGLVNHRADIFVYGDASGAASHADSARPGGSLQILRDVFGANLEGRVYFRVKAANPAIRLREAAVNRGLCSADGVRSHFFGSWCTAHIDDFREIVPDPKTGVAKKESKPKHASPSDDYWKRTHATDGWGYHVDFRWPFEIPTTDRLPAMADLSDHGPLYTGWRAP